MKLDNLLRFIELTQKFGQVRRIVLVRKEMRLENDLEHTAQLALVAWYVCEHNNLRLNLDRVLKYAIVHDLVEVYAGDTYVYSKNKQKLARKAAREKKAALKIKKEFPKLKEVHRLIKNYELRHDKESKFVYALDKALPALNIYLDKGRTWRKYKISLAQQREAKRNKINVSPEVLKYWEQLTTILEKNEKKLFNTKQNGTKT